MSAAILAAMLAAAAPVAHPDDCAAPAGDRLLAEGCAALDRFMTAFNARDAGRWAATLHFPHVRLAAGQVQVWRTAADYAKSNDVRDLAKGGWAYTRWDWRTLAQRSDDKLHFLVSFTRYGRDHRPIGSYQSLYIVTRDGSGWGTQARSSYAGIAAKNSAF